MDDALAKVLAKLKWLRDERIWPQGLRYLWTDAFGLTLLVSLHQALGDDRYLEQAKWLVAEVERVLGRRTGIRIGEQPDRDGQYFHYLAMWLFALGCLGKHDERYRQKAIALAQAIHPRFVLPGVGVIWKMREDLSGPYPGFGLGALDAFHGMVVYRLLDATSLRREIAELSVLVERSYSSLHVTQDLGLGMLLWFSHFFPLEPWAVVLRERSLGTLEHMWIDPPGYFCREPALPQTKFAFTNFGVSLGLQAVNAHPRRVAKLHAYFDVYRSGDHYDRDAITHVMHCCSLYPGALLQAQ